VATVYGVNYNNAFQVSPVVNTPAAEAGGRVRVIKDSYTAAAGVTAGSSIFLGGLKLPEGAIIHGFTLDHEAMGAGVTLQLRRLGASDVSISSVFVTTSAGVKTEGASQGKVPHAVSEAASLFLLTGVATLSVSATVQVMVFYSID
jgi:hypothetical protein